VSPRARADLLVCTALVAGVFVVYRGVFDVYFLNEDFSWLWRCRLAAPTTIWTLLTRDVMGGLYSWRPLLQLSFGLNEALWGVHPFGYRLAGLAWQALAACALYAIGARVADRRRGALAAALFAVHPVQVESLSWTCARGGPISTALLLLAMLGFLAWQHRRQRHGRQLWMVLVPFALALATLETSVVFVALVLAADVLLSPAMRLGRRLQLYAALLVVVVGLLSLRHASSPAAMNMNMVGFDPRWPLSAGQLALFVLRKLQATAALLLTLDGQPGWVTAAIAVAAAAAAVVCWWRGRWLGLWGLVWILVASAPFTLLLLGPYPRHLHLAMVGFGLLFAELLVTVADAVARRNRRLAVVCVGGLMVLWFGLMVRNIDQAAAEVVERGRLSEALLTDLRRLVPHPQPGSELAFYRLGDLRAHQHVFVYGFEDAVRLLYNDDTLRIQFGTQGSAPQATYQLWYADGRLVLVSGARS
jgi:4-amino-4-deoxy-L-arabinose transferase-like glycosyltransferase